MGMGHSTVKNNDPIFSVCLVILHNNTIIVIFVLCSLGHWHITLSQFNFLTNQFRLPHVRFHLFTVHIKYAFACVRTTIVECFKYNNKLAIEALNINVEITRKLPARASQCSACFRSEFFAVSLLSLAFSHSTLARENLLTTPKC